MKSHTYSFRAKNFSTKEVVQFTIEADGKENAQNAAMKDEHFKGWEILLSSFKRTDTAKGPNRAGGLDSNGKQINAKTVRQSIEQQAYKDFLINLDKAIENLYLCNFENNAAVLSMPIKQLYKEMSQYNPFIN